jgi:small subunit ribosomal protein S4
MTKVISAKHKIDRRLGVNLWGRPKSPFNTRPLRPGQHGQRRSKLSDYGQQLMAKQKLKGYYGRITEKQFHRFYVEARRCKGDTGENLVGLLERRLDAVVYRARFASTIFAARQLVSHNHILVNGKRVNIGSYLVKDGDVISVKQASWQMPVILESLQSAENTTPSYLEVDMPTFSAKFLHAPKLGDIPYPVKMEPSLVVEFYSR